MASKFALIIANTEYQDLNFAKLTAPGKDAEEFAKILQDLANFEVKVLLNKSEGDVSRAISRFFVNRKIDDLLLVYFSGHGVRSDDGRLFLATTDTDMSILDATGISSDFIANAMNGSRSQRQILVLDCCNSGAFAHGRKTAVAIGSSMGMGTAFEGGGKGRVVLTATDATQYAWEGDQIIGNKVQTSVFTNFLIYGLKGDADKDGDGKITVDELYDYAFDQVLKVTPKQTPSRWSYNERGDVVLRDNLKIHEVKPSTLPDDLLSMLSNVNSSIRRAGIQDAITLLDRNHPGLARAAQEKLLELSEKDDSLNLRDMARNALQERNLLDLKPYQKKPIKFPSDNKFSVLNNKSVMTIVGVLVLSLCVWSIGIAINNLGAQPNSIPTPVSTQVIATEETQPPPTQTILAPPTEIHPTPVVPTIMPTGKDGMPLILIPAGEFKMGSSSGEVHERPIHTVYLDSFLIDQTEVTNAMYAVCVENGDCNPPRANTSITQNASKNSFYYGNPKFDNYPVIYVSWIDAKAYCKSVDRRLPTEAEWEKAASWDDAPGVKRVYPWGNMVDCSYTNYYSDGALCIGDTTPVGSYLTGASFYGVLDMAGNVWEWVADRYDPEYYGKSVYSNPQGPASGDFMVIRGGSFLVGGSNGIRSSYREKQTPDIASHNIGFRCAVDAP